MLRRVLLLSGAAALLTPSAALAATTYTVDATAANGCNGTTCKTIGQANAKLADGDTIEIKPGVYVEDAAIDVTKANVTIKAATAGFALVAAKAGDANKGKPVLTLEAGGTVDGLTIGGGTDQGAALALGASGTVKRTTLLATNSAASGLTVTAAPGAANAVTATLDSTIIGAGSGAPGLAITGAATNVPPAHAPAITVKGVHVTIAGGNKPVAVLAQADPMTASGNISASFDRSILHGSGASTATADTPTTPLLGGPPATVALTIKDSDATDTTAGTVTVTGGQKSSDASLFADAAKSNYHLRVGSPAIDKAGGAVSGESETDVDGQPRVTGSASDIGGDEFVNVPPVAKITASAAEALPGDSVSFDMSGSVDPDAGGGIPTYAISFGDGQSYVGNVPGATHAYAKPGAYTVRAAVLDSLGTPSQVAQVAVNVKDVAKPLVAITSPRPSQRFSLLTKTKKVRQIAITGTASDLSGIGKVELSIKRVSVTKTPAKKKSTKKAKAKAKKSQASCTYLIDGKAQFGAKSCSKPAFFVIAPTATGFAYRTKSSTAFKRGVYDIVAQVTDKAGNVTTTAPVRIRLT